MSDFEAFAEFEFELAAPIDEGEGSLMDHLLAAERQTGVTPELLLNRPQCPEGCEPLWLIFKELHASRGHNGFGPMRITFTEIDAYVRVTGASLKPWEVDAIRRADKAFITDWQSRQKTG